MPVAPEPPAVVAAAAASRLPEAVSAARAGRMGEAEGLLRQHLAAHPDDEEARFWLARVVAWQGRFGEAIGLYDALLKDAPTNMDYVLGKGQVLLWAGRPAEALACAETARRRAPELVEAWRLSIAALSALGPGRRAEAIARATEARTRFPGHAWTLPAEPAAPKAAATPIEVEAGVAYDWLSNGYAPWYTGHATGRAVLAPRTTVYGRFQETNRFGLWDSELLVGGTLPLGLPATAIVEASVSPTGQVLASWSGTGMVEFAPRPWLVTWLRGRHASYPGTNLTVGTAGVEGYVGRFRLTAALSGSRTSAPGLPLSGQFALTYSPTDRDMVAVRLAAGQENEVLGPRRVVLSNIFSAGLEGRWFFHEAWALTGELGLARQGTFYDRAHLQVGLRRAL